MTKQIKLSHREYEVLCMLKEGLHNKDIAVKLNINVKSISTYVRRLKTKTGTFGKNSYVTVKAAEERDYFNIDNVLSKRVDVELKEKKLWQVK